MSILSLHLTQQWQRSQVFDSLPAVRSAPTGFVDGLVLGFLGFLQGFLDVPRLLHGLHLLIEHGRGCRFGWCRGSGVIRILRSVRLRALGFSE